MSDDRKPLRAAVVGLGSPGRSHMAGYTACPGVQVVAVCDPNAELLVRVADDYAVEARYSSYEKMLAGEQIDVVSVATPNHVHADPAVAALNSGMHVLVEKPMARTCAEARLMVDAAERNDRMLEVTFNKRFGSDARVVKAFVDGGGVGEIYHAKSRWLRRSGIPGTGSSWFINKEMSGGGPLIDLGVHMLDLALHIMGEPEVMAVSAATYNKLGQRFTTERHGPHAVYEVEDFATAFIRLSGGRTLALSGLPCQMPCALHGTAQTDGATGTGGDRLCSTAANLFGNTLNQPLKRSVPG